MTAALSLKENFTSLSTSQNADQSTTLKLKSDQFFAFLFKMIHCLLQLAQEEWSARHLLSDFYNFPGAGLELFNKLSQQITHTSPVFSTPKLGSNWSYSWAV